MTDLMVTVADARRQLHWDPERDGEVFDLITQVQAEFVARTNRPWFFGQEEETFDVRRDADRHRQQEA